MECPGLNAPRGDYGAQLTPPKRLRRGETAAQLAKRTTTSARAQVIPHDARRNEDQQLVAIVLIELVLEQRTDDRDIAQQRNLVDCLLLGLSEDAADAHGAAVLHQNLSVHLLG